MAQRASGKRELDMINYWASIGEKYFDYQETFSIKPSMFQTWRHQMHAADEDIPALAWLCSKQLDHLSLRAPHNYSLFDQWPTFIRGNDPQLYRELEKGYACLHLHLSGSYPAPYYWIGLMNRRFDENQLIDRTAPESLRGYRTHEDIDSIVQLIDLARIARSKLFQYVKGRNDESALIRTKDDCGFLNKPEEEKFDDLGVLTDIAQLDITKWEKAVCPSLIGERYLLFRIIRTIQTIEDTSIAKSLSAILWAYVVAKHKFLNTVQQAEGVAGFDYFEHTFRFVKWRQTKRAEQERCAGEIGSFLQESGCLVKLELMIAPKHNADDYTEDIRLATLIQTKLKERQLKRVFERCGMPRVGLIVHFIKDYGEPLDERMTSDKQAFRAYHHTARDRVTKEFNELAKHFGKGTAEEVQICGIDAANRELYCPPEIFSEIFRRAVPELRRQSGDRLRTIGRTFHVGEDFVHLTTGLRRIYEALAFLDLRPGDRIGHACALGIDPERWTQTNPTVEMHIIDILDDAVFEALLLRDRNVKTGVPIDESRMSQLIRTIDECCVYIFGSAIPLIQLEKAWRMRARVSRRKAANFKSDESVPEWVREQHKKYKSVHYNDAGSHSLVLQPRDIVKTKADLPADIAERIAIEYQHDIRTIRRFLQIRPVDVTQAAKNIAALQLAVSEEANERGITIESNPSSNWLIGGLESHIEVPAVRWLLSTVDPSSRVAFTINSDDPTVFATSIENEYFMVFSAAVHSARSISRVECLREIDSIRERSLQSSFID